MENSINQYSFSFHRDVYSIQAVMKTAYLFTEAFYIYIDIDDNHKTVVLLKPKLSLNSSELEFQAGEFLNELLHQSIRLEVSSQTKGIRELIMGRALFSTVMEMDMNLGELQESNHIKEPIMDNYQSDEWNIGRNFFDKDKKVL